MADTDTDARSVQLAAISLADTVLTTLEDRGLDDATTDAILDALCMKLTAHRATIYEQKGASWARR